MTIIRYCEVCGAPITSGPAIKKYCSKECSAKGFLLSERFNMFSDMDGRDIYNFIIRQKETEDEY